MVYIQPNKRFQSFSVLFFACISQTLSMTEAKTVLNNFTIFTKKTCEYCQIFKNAYFEEHLRTAAYAMNLLAQI